MRRRDARNPDEDPSHGCARTQVGRYRGELTNARPGKKRNALMTNSAEAIASKIRAGYAEGAIAGARIHGSLAADKVEIHHLPAGPKDGIWDGPKWATALLEAVRSLQNAISDFRQEAEIAVVGDEIRIV